nr:crotonase/enoyl-CoA hydratase family protein [Sphingomonas sp. CDS-1]
MSEILFERADGIATITINRPRARNSVNQKVAEGMAEALAEIDRDEGIRVGIITGAGGYFCAGMDLKAFLKDEKVKVEGGGFAGITEARTAKPVIAAVEGFALAGGFEIALACDLIVASQEARFGLPEVKRGLVANAGGLVRLPRQLPYRIALQLVLTGDIVEAPVLARFGLINRLTAPGAALQEAKRLAAEIAVNAPLALAASKRVMQESQYWSSDDLFARQNRITAPVIQSADAREGAVAFAEKRAPVWRNR